MSEGNANAFVIEDDFSDEWGEMDVVDTVPLNPSPSLPSVSTPKSEAPSSVYTFSQR